MEITKRVINNLCKHLFNLLGEYTLICMDILCTRWLMPPCGLVHTSAKPELCLNPPPPPPIRNVQFLVSFATIYIQVFTGIYLPLMFGTLK